MKEDGNSPEAPRQEKIIELKPGVYIIGSCPEAKEGESALKVDVGNKFLGSDAALRSSHFKLVFTKDGIATIQKYDPKTPDFKINIGEDGFKAQLRRLLQLFCKL